MFSSIFLLKLIIHIISPQPRRTKKRCAPSTPLVSTNLKTSINPISALYILSSSTLKTSLTLLPFSLPQPYLLFISPQPRRTKKRCAPSTPLVSTNFRSLKTSLARQNYLRFASGIASGAFVSCFTFSVTGL